ncbi:UDP-N-acetylmuramoyl-L-alanyl-D-glutamate--2,6-diaminopimelate ligase [Glutamicibacter sp. MNS18]|uniref:UDP-N-acetylmuramoyl-L-alanyl-D-glutamate--2, 6-diaminopimelate ligase n=1 Tax=Glutamicibacter sp. MNS18 TaxID=2989817 RepID=UPI002236335F|nr:UDP-N-acetylmuramoyl-L-alanyl-D-glutamate--2,6-diaminopimelate ligase [Glutamicibacter sp. MNS18]MCW4464413.1 UDP-N-acetylmuramoyl-L-alanyl-D-glutamate--2,6-diaminopimelate ligase [Glutamicibacter sp. MNS18]
MVNHEQETPRDLERYLRPSSPVPVAWPTICEAVNAVTGTAGPADLKISGVSLNPQTVQPGDVFLAISGAKRHGAQFLSAALRHGARAVITDTRGSEIIGPEPGVPVAVVTDVRAVAATVAATIYGTNLRTPELFAVTGTNGKTTTTFMIRALLEALGRATGIVGTIEMSARGKIIPSVLTTPEATQLHGVLGRMTEQDVDSVAMEVSSHSLSYGRVDGLEFAVSGYTNLTQDHLDLHGSMDDYFATKARLFTPGRSRRAVVLVDDHYGRKLAAEAGIEVQGLSLDAANADAYWTVSTIHASGLGHTFTLASRDGVQLRARTGLPGAFNVANAALALAMVLASGADPAAVQQALDSRDPFSLSVPGRMQVVAERPVAVVDFAHNSDALAKALDSLPVTAAGRRIIVFGATGERDTSKRPDMGAVAARHADVVIVTDDDPHDEAPGPIRDQVEAGARQAIEADGLEVELHNVAPRDRAVEFAVSLANAEDAILVAGRGHEVYQEVAGIDVSLDDREELAKSLAKHGYTPVSAFAQSIE